MAPLQFLPEAFLISEVNGNGFRAFQYEGDRTVDFGQGFHRWMTLEDRLGRLARLELMNDDVQSNPGASHVIAAIADFDVSALFQCRSFSLAYVKYAFGCRKRIYFI